MNISCHLQTEAITQIEWHRFDEAIPAFLAMILIPLTYSITDSVAYGFLAFVVLKSATGCAKEIKAGDVDHRGLLTRTAFAVVVLFIETETLHHDSDRLPRPVTDLPGRSRACR